jgi:hypothetical protein
VTEGRDPHPPPPPDPAARVPGPPPPEVDGPAAVAHPGHHHPFRDATHALADAAVEAEMETGRHEETLEEARAGAIRRTLRATGGFMVIGVGIALLPLPGPGWVVIILGLSMLPFAWAERTILTIRRNIPGIPDEGRIPLSTWIVMGVMVVAFTTLAILFGGSIGAWLGDLWSRAWE